MAKGVKQRPDLQAVPLLKHEPLYIGIDVGLLKFLSLLNSACDTVCEWL